MKLKTDDGNYSFWDENRGKIRSRKGGWVLGRGVYSHGFNILEDLLGRVSYFQVMILNATGKMVDRRFSFWLESFYTCLSWPDPRIWCNQIGALGGTMRSSVVASTASGILAAESKIYGQKTLVAGLGFIQRALREVKDGLPVGVFVSKECEKLGGKPHIMGFARPLATGDERVNSMELITKKLKYEIGEHLSLAYEIERILQSRFGESMNINGYGSAFLSDQGFTPHEAYRICTTIVNSGVTACCVDSLERPPESFLPMRCDDIIYKGPSIRPVPR